MTPSCLKRVWEMYARDRLLTARLYTVRSAVPGGYVEALVWERSIRCDPVLRQRNGDVAIERAILYGLRALEAQGRVVRREIPPPAGPAQSLVCWRLRTAPSATT